MTAAALDHRIWYAASNEDGASEIAALAPRDRRVLSITASGSRTFDLLTAAPREIVSIDQNPAQTALAELLAEGYRRFDYPAFARFVGLECHGAIPASERGVLIEALSPASRRFWNANPTLIDQGLVYSGRWEGFLRTIHRLAGPRRRRIARDLLAAPSLAAQAAIWRERWDTRSWRLLLRLLSVRWFWRTIAREPGIAFVPRDFDIAGYVAARFDHAAHHIRFAESPFAWLMLTGAYPKDVRPPYLSEAHFATIAGQIDRVAFVTGSLQSYLADALRDRFDAVSLSDYSSYCDVMVQRALWQSLRHALAPGGRACERKFFNKVGTDLPEQSGFVRDTVVEDRLAAEDRAFFYSFVVATRR